MEQTVTKSEFFFPSVNGVNRIHAIEWQPDGAPRAVIQLAHGVAEYIDRYNDFASFLAENGIAVAGNDHLGHGKSVRDASELGWFGDTDGWSLVVGDMKQLHDRLTAKYPGLPCYLLGHSMGSFLARTYLIRYPDDLDGVILSGTGQQNAVTCFAGLAMARGEIKKHGSQYHSQKLQALAFGSYLKHIEAPASPFDWLSRDPELVARYDADPLCGFDGTAGLMRDMMSGLDFIRRPANLAKMRKLLPVFFLSGADDPVGGWSKGVKQAAASFLKAGMKDVKLRLYDGGRHEMLNETNKEEVWNDILDWLNAKTQA